MLWPLAVLMLVMGVVPNLWFRDIQTAQKPVVMQQSKATGLPGPESTEMLSQPDVSLSTNHGEVQR